MALQRQIWLNSIVELLFASNTFAARSIDHSAFVTNKTVHVPNAGSAPSVTKNRSVFPASASQRTDYDLTYDINEYSTNPVHIQNAEQVELSYNKRESVLKQMKAALADSVHIDLALSWVPSGYAKVGTSGAATPSHLATTTGNRQAMTKADVLAVKNLFDLDDVPQEGRCILLDAVMYNQLLASLSESEAAAFNASVDAQRGVVGRLYGFDFYMRSTVFRVVAAGTSMPSSAGATDSAAGLAWQEDCVSRALGNHELFENEKDALYYGDVMSALVRAGGKYIRNDKKGVAVIYQVTP
ncbi:MAG: hypothetical protein MJZ78_03990 [Bacteroidales bacterium]|nr:hypothetical protein [Bacteroidales bacterium]